MICLTACATPNNCKYIGQPNQHFSCYFPVAKRKKKFVSFVLTMINSRNTLSFVTILEKFFLLSYS